MPVAKLSREFYEKFGDKLTDELVSCLNAIEGSYRAELRDLFDAQFGRFDEKLERRLSNAALDVGARVTGLRADLDLEIEQLRADLSLKIEQLRADLGLKIEQLRADLGLKIEQLRGELHSTKADMLKWSLGLWVPVALAVIGLYFKR